MTTHDHDKHSHALVGEGHSDSQLLAETLKSLTQQIARAVDCSECCIYEYLPERRAIRAQAIWSDDLTERDRAWIGQLNDLTTIPDFAEVVTRRTVLVAYAEDEHVTGPPGPETMAYWGELAAVWAPIVANDEVLGVLELTEKHARRRFGEADKLLVRRMADLAALALRNARDSRAVAARNRQLTALIDSSRAMTSTLVLDEVLDVVCRQTAQALGAQSSYMYAFDPEGDTVVWLAEYQRDPSHSFEEPLGTVYLLDDVPQHRAVIRSRRPAQVSLDDPDIDPTNRKLLLDWEELSSLMVPLIVGQDVVGILEVSESERVRRFTREETALCTALGEQAAAAIRNAQLYGQLQEQKQTIELQATTDGLTGLYNHRHFFERLRAEAVRARRYGFALSVIMLDLDDFKLVNDRHGHPAGDQVLSTVGDILRAQVREDVDVPARYGGEEFAVILPHTGPLRADLAETANGAQAIAERIRRAVAEVELPLPLTSDGLPVHMTASVGVATLPAHAVDADDLVNKADRALYKAKQRGKDRVEVYVAG
ncbi:MAG: sensor domain-containing diguanylate cyclase [Actinobacteria bacterium]|nr:sensor domain-containing diguanylate cyclase [Actinomycetota bacterium]